MNQLKDLRNQRRVKDFTSPLVTRRLRDRLNEEVRRRTVQLLISGVVKPHRLRWAGHVTRAPPTRYVRQVLGGRLTSPRPQGRPWLRWEYCVSKDAGLLGIPDWREAC